MSYVQGLKCKECGHRVPVGPVHVCEQCFGPYEVEYDYARMKGKVTRQSIEAGPDAVGTQIDKVVEIEIDAEFG